MSYKDLGLNEEAAAQADDLISASEMVGIQVVSIGGTEVVDCGVNVPGSLFAGQALAEICMGGLGEVTTSLGHIGDRPCPKVTVQIDLPTLGCLVSQYAGWKISHENYFAMASGPIRAVRGREPLFDRIDYSEEEFDIAVGVLEASALPTEAVIEHMAAELDLQPEELLLLVAPTASIAGAMQVVSRSVETCLHKLFELGFDVQRIHSAIGTAFLPPVPKDDLTAIGRTNDSILYGAEVFLWLDGDDESIREVGPKVPSSSSADYGEPFASIFQRYNGDFYQIDPLLFSPARVTFNNIKTGLCETYGKLDLDLVAKSFFGS